MTVTSASAGEETGRTLPSAYWRVRTRWVSADYAAVVARAYSQAIDRDTTTSQDQSVLTRSSPAEHRGARTGARAQFVLASIGEPHRRNPAIRKHSWGFERVPQVRWRIRTWPWPRRTTRYRVLRAQWAPARRVHAARVDY